MQIHHSKHHAAYVNNFNLLLPQYQEAEHKGDLAKMIALQPALKFNGGTVPLLYI
jgi:superoxide dismutase